MELLVMTLTGQDTGPFRVAAVVLHTSIQLVVTVCRGNKVTQCLTRVNYLTVSCQDLFTKVTRHVTPLRGVSGVNTLCNGRLSNGVFTPFFSLGRRVVIEVTVGSITHRVIATTLATTLTLTLSVTIAILVLVLRLLTLSTSTTLTLSVTRALLALLLLGQHFIQYFQLAVGIVVIFRRQFCTDTRIGIVRQIFTEADRLDSRLEQRDDTGIVADNVACLVVELRISQLTSATMLQQDAVEFHTQDSSKRCRVDAVNELGVVFDNRVDRIDHVHTKSYIFVFDSTALKQAVEAQVVRNTSANVSKSATEFFIDCLNK